MRIENTTGTALRFDQQWGSLAFAGVASVDGSSGGVWLETADIPCDCVCAPDVRCPECEEPADRWLDVPAGETRDVPWPGYVRRLRDGEECQERFAPPSGLYVFSACAHGGAPCASTRATLPTSDPIVLSFAESGRVESCDALSEVDVQRAALVSLRQIRRAGLGDRLAGCGSAAAECVAADAVDAARRAVPAGGCRHLVVPRGDHLEVETVLPLPPGTNGGESYRVFLDPAGARVREVRFEQ